MIVPGDAPLYSTAFPPVESQSRKSFYYQHQARLLLARTAKRNWTTSLIQLLAQGSRTRNINNLIKYFYKIKYVTITNILFSPPLAGGWGVKNVEEELYIRLCVEPLCEALCGASYGA